MGSLVVGDYYIITTLAGSTDAQWKAAGNSPFSGTSAAGDIFQAGTVGAGTGVATPAVADVFLLDPEYLALSYLQGYRTESLAKTGLAEKWQMSVDWTLVVNNEAAHAMIGDIKQSAAATY